MTDNNCSGHSPTTERETALALPRQIGMRCIAALVILAQPGQTWAERPGTAPMQDKTHCESHTPRVDRRDIVCSLIASGTTQRFRFTARFAGSHDDTAASLTPTLEGRPLACEKGSKTNLSGEEEGDAALECRFSITGAAGAELSLRVNLAWYHARYTDFEVGPE